MKNEPIVLATERLLLREIREADADILVKWRSDPETYQYFKSPHQITREEHIVWYTTFAYMGSARNIWLLAEGKQKHLWKINLVGAAANVVLNALLIPMMGVNGAALASLATQFLTNVVTGWVYRPIRGINGIILEGLKPKTFIRIAGKMIGELRQRGLKRQAG